MLKIIAIYTKNYFLNNLFRYLFTYLFISTIFLLLCYVLNCRINCPSSFLLIFMRYTLMTPKYRYHERTACPIRWGIMSRHLIKDDRALLGKAFVSKAFAETVCLRRITLTLGYVVHRIYTIFILSFRDRVSSGRDLVFTRQEKCTRSERRWVPTTLGTEVWRVPYTFHEVHFPTKLLDDVHATSFRQDRRERLHTG